MSAARKLQVGVQPIPIAKIRTDGGTQQREQITSDAVFEMMDAIIDGVELPPILVYSDGTDCWLVDGYHRLDAHRRAGRELVVADVRRGSLREAILASVGANATHGVRRTREDKRKAVRTLLLDEEWSKWTDRAIATACNVSHPMVASERGKVTGNVTSRPQTNADNQRIGRDGRTYDVSALRATKPAPPLRLDDTAAIDAAVNRLAVLLRNVDAYEQRPCKIADARAWLARALGLEILQPRDWDEIVEEGCVKGLWIAEAVHDGGPLERIWLVAADGAGDEGDPAWQGHLASLEDTDDDTDEEEYEERQAPGDATSDEDLEEGDRDLDPDEGAVVKTAELLAGGSSNGRTAAGSPARADAERNAGSSPAPPIAAQVLEDLEDADTDEDIDAPSEQRTEGEVGVTAPSAALAPAERVSERPDYDSDSWGTPAEIIEDVRAVLEEIDLDPASNDAAQRTVDADVWYTKAEDGLAHQWYGRVWLNPPFSHPLVEQFTDKLVAEYDAGRVTAALLVVNNASDTRWFQRLLKRFPACFIAGRIAFIYADGSHPQARQGQTFFYLGPDKAKFREVFGTRGTIVEALGAIVEALGAREVA